MWLCLETRFVPLVHYLGYTHTYVTFLETKIINASQKHTESTFLIYICNNTNDYQDSDEGITI